MGIYPTPPMKTLKISDKTHQRLKLQAAALGVSVQDLAEHYLVTSQSAVDSLGALCVYKPQWMVSSVPDAKSKITK